MIRVRTRPGTNAADPSLGIAATRGTRYPRAWRIPIARTRGDTGVLNHLGHAG
jgi:hypothetical protein